MRRRRGGRPIRSSQGRSCRIQLSRRMSRPGCDRSSRTGRENPRRSAPSFGGSRPYRPLDCASVTTVDVDRLLALLRDPNVERQEIAALPAPLAAALCRAAVQAGRTDVVAALAAHASKDVAKEAKRNLHVLRTRGVAVPEPPRSAAPPGPAAAEPPLPAYASAIDGRGERALWIPRAVPGKGIEVAQAVVSDTGGLLDLQVGLLGRKEWRAFAKGLLDRGATMGVGEMDPERARSVLVAARARNDASGQRVPEGADLWLARLGPATPPPDPAARFAPLPEDEERAALAASGALHDLPLLRSWLAEEDYLRTVAGRLDEIAVSPLYLDDRQRADQMARTVSDAVDAY